MEKGPSKRVLSWLKGTLLEWEEEGLIPPSSAEKIRERYNLDQVEVIDTSYRLVAVFSIIGALLVGAGVILLIASNWRDIPRWGKLIIIFGTILGVNQLGFYLKYVQGKYPKVGGALIFLGALLFGGGIWLVAQIFHVTSRYHRGLLFWALGIFPVALLLRSDSILTVSSFLVSFWGIWKAVDFRDPNYVYLVPMLALMLPSSYRARTRVPLFVSVAGLAAWFVTSHGTLLVTQKHSLAFLFLLSLSFGVALYASGLLQSHLEKTSPFAWVYLFVGAFLSYVALYFLSFRESFRFFVAGKSLKTLMSYFPVVSAVVMVLAVFQLVVSSYMRKKEFQGMETFFLAELSFLAILLTYSLAGPLVHSSEFHGIVTNLLLLALSVGTIYVGYYRGRPLFVNIGFLFFSVHFGTRFFDWGWRYFPRSVFFLVAGIILILGAAVLERKRRRLLRLMRGGQCGG